MATENLTEVKELLSEKFSGVEEKFKTISESIEERDVASGKDKEEAAKRGDEAAEQIKSMEAEMLQLKTENSEIKKWQEEKELAAGRLEENQENSHKSVGEMLTDNPEFKKAVDNKQNFGMHIEGKALTSSTVGSMATSTIYTNPELLANPDPLLHMRDLLRMVPVQGGTVQLIKETGFSNLLTSLTATVGSGATSVAVANPQGFYVGQTVTLVDGANTVDFVVTVVDLAAKTLACASITTSHTYAVATTRVTTTSFAPTQEGEIKIESDFTTALETLTLETLAHFIDVTNQMLQDAPLLRDRINNKLLQGLYTSEDQQLMSGTGTDPNLTGILNTTGIQTYSWSSGVIGDNQIDAVLKASILATVTNYVSDAVVMNFTDYANLKTMKGTSSNYLLAQDAKEIWMIPMVPATFITAGTFLTGSFSQGAAVYYHDGVEIAYDPYGSNFKKNMSTIRGEERLILGVERPQAFVKGTWDNAPV